MSSHRYEKILICTDGEKLSDKAVTPVWRWRSPWTHKLSPSLRWTTT